MRIVAAQIVIYRRVGESCQPWSLFAFCNPSYRWGNKPTAWNEVTTVGSINKVTSVCFSFVQLSSADLKKPLEKETAKLKEMRENMMEKAPGMHVYVCSFFMYAC